MLNQFNNLYEKETDLSEKIDGTKTVDIELTINEKQDDNQENKDYIIANTIN